MSAKTLNIIGCKDHKHKMSNRLELSVGFQGENYMFGCLGCVNRGFIWNANAPQDIFLIIANSQDNNKSVANYCLYCSVGTLERLKQDLVNKEVFFCPCNLCAFETMSNPQKPQDLMNSQEVINTCFCALSRFNLLGKLNQDIIDYQKDEYARKHRNLSGFSERNK